MFQDEAKYGVDLYISGHTHLQNVSFQGETAYIISGGGGGITSEILPTTTGEDDGYGFMDVIIQHDAMYIYKYSHGVLTEKIKLDFLFGAIFLENWNVPRSQVVGGPRETPPEKVFFSFGNRSSASVEGGVEKQTIIRGMTKVRPHSAGGLAQVVI